MSCNDFIIESNEKNDLNKEYFVMLIPSFKITYIFSKIFFNAFFYNSKFIRNKFSLLFKKICLIFFSNNDVLYK